jgi:hypothetical protein
MLGPMVWAFSKLLVTPTLACWLIFCILAAAGFVIAGAGIFFSQTWWYLAAITSAVLSALLFIFFWNGQFLHLDGQGAVGILIDVVILVAILEFRWPKFDF